MVRIPFHYGLFYHAMIGLVGRTPDTSVCQGFDGFYDFIYKPLNEDEQKRFSEYASTFRSWLDHFDIKFSGSRCEFGSWENDKKDEYVLRVMVTHEVLDKNHE